MYDELTNKHREIFRSSTDYLRLRSPGRINLIGEHTDYNNGFVFPAAIDKEILGVAVRRNDKTIRVYSMDFNAMKSLHIDDSENKSFSWIDYVKAVVNELKEIGGLNHGADIVYKSNLPADSGLSSSASFELINALLFSHINGIDISKKDLALLCQRAENNYIGVKCGIMDQFAIALAKKNTSLFIDTETLDYKPVKIDLSQYKIVIANTKKSRALSDSAYNERRSECEEAVKILKKTNPGIESLRDVEPDFLQENSSLLGEVIYKRAKHVVFENQRVLLAVEALENNDISRFGELMVESHYSLKNLYEVSCLELDTLVEQSLEVDGVAGSRMTGAGFGGCIVSLVRNESVQSLIETVGRGYRKETGLSADFYITNIPDGTEIIQG